jgi:hypothetical protein
MLRQAILSVLILGAGTLSAPAASVSKPTHAAVQTDAASRALISEWSDQRRRRRADRPAPAPGPRIACTDRGCNPIPTGCEPVPGVNWRGNLTGFDRVVCPRR